MVLLIHLRDFSFHIVAQVIKGKFIICGIRHVTGVSGRLFIFGLLWIDDPSCKSKSAIDFRHPVTVAFGKVIVYRHDMYTLTAECVEIGGKGRDKRFAFAGFHFRNIALMKENTPHQLHVKGA